LFPISVGVLAIKENRHPVDELATREETPEQTKKREQGNAERRIALQAEFRQSLPGYIVRSIDYVTSPTEAIMQVPTAEAQTPNAAA
jgi:hypothetical protein